MRLTNLDYLRGICAFGIMIFHYSVWTDGIYPSESFITRIGIYGVSIFYILSGITLCHVYRGNLQLNMEGMRTFYVKRIFRIFPLLWLATFLTILSSRQIPETGLLLNNLTGLFALFRWDETIAYGSWSIGNELVFYLLFPILLFASKSKRVFYFLLMVLLAIYLYFAFGLLDPAIAFYDQWHTYTNPLNQCFLFGSGFALSFTFGKIRFPNWLTIGLLLLSAMVFVFYPVEGERINLVSGVPRMVFTVLAVVMCFCLFKTDVRLPGWLSSLLSKLGECSYSLYLLHPILYKVVMKILSVWSLVFFVIPTSIALCISGIITLISSYLIYYHFERYFIRKGSGLFFRIFLKKSPESSGTGY